MAETPRLKKLLKEPLVHFLGGALLVFGFFWATGSDRDPADYAIAVDATDIDRLRAGWIRNFRREPTATELDGLIDQEIREEIYYREALRLGLDRNDPVIRRRLFTKMRFLRNAEADLEPADAVLQQWLEENPEKYGGTGQFDLEQVYLGQAGEMDENRIAQLRDRLNAGQKENAGKAISLPESLQATETETVARLFGEGFARALGELPVGSWEGPVLSGFGLHLVKIANRKAGTIPVLDDVRQQVRNDWRAAETQKAEEGEYQKLRGQYDIRIAGQD
ncbi:PPIC-type PPIASE domain-containing protein [Parasphingorhabdus marina DSM 22363]|uniref:PPIC-type PPIASE domain-containing protein n=1 Tax=Parasphingorhabdus marina DSM 22363 TaxID=1123272 RepID=A0A1N6CNF3_9SPHN|nr:peptidylprolyl isomerase [Parasphingorhabdus marina]SIN59999.1 PPIC-type PPIASE domain-containing protein [Parasphingorhabdus marina DSM 22363]